MSTFYLRFDSDSTPSAQNLGKALELTPGVTNVFLVSADDNRTPVDLGEQLSDLLFKIDVVHRIEEPAFSVPDQFIAGWRSALSKVWSILSDSQQLRFRS